VVVMLTRKMASPWVFRIKQNYLLLAYTIQLSLTAAGNDINTVIFVAYEHI
jgi:hypothetical protein